VAVATVGTGSIASHYTATATLEAEADAQVVSRISGVVQSLECEEGDRVAEGQPLLRIDNDEYLLRLRQAEARTANLRSIFERKRDMYDENLVSAEEFDTARNDLATAEADEDLARLNLSYTTVTSPFTGRVTARLVDVGQNVSVGTVLFSVADFDPLLARVHVPAREFRRLMPDQPVDLSLDSDGRRLSGKITLVSPVIDPTSGTIKVTVEIPDYPEGTRPGDFAEVSIVTERRDDVTLVPQVAVVTEKGDQVVFVALPGEEDGPMTAERRLVEVGFTDRDHTQILSGVEPGERVVVKGQRSLKHGAAIRILEEDGNTAPELAARDADA
jgi:membrane fusion protein (multidrug efflux system)